MVVHLQRQIQARDTASMRAQEEAQAQLAQATKQADLKLSEAESARKALLQRVAAAEAEQSKAAQVLANLLVSYLGMLSACSNCILKLATWH